MGNVEIHDRQRQYPENWEGSARLSRNLPDAPQPRSSLLEKPEVKRNGRLQQQVKKSKKEARRRRGLNYAKGRR